MAKTKDIREVVGFPLVEVLEQSYLKWKEAPSKANQKRYLTWRLRLRVKLQHRPELLLELMEKCPLTGLLDEEVGPLYDDLDPGFT
ncbi:MAG: hypothetical protein ACO22S_05195 [Burkholderiaceae bacterium]